MRRINALAVTAVLVALAGLTLSAVDQTSVHAAAPAQANDSPCVVTHTKTAAPDVVRLGGTVDVTLTVETACPGAPLPLSIVLVLDGSGNMAGGPNGDMKRAVGTFVRGLDLGAHPERLVGVVEFNTQASRLCSLENRESRVLACVNRVGASGGTRIDLGMLEGLRVLNQGRRGQNRDELNEVMIVLSDGGNNVGCAPVLSAARQVRGQGVMIFAVCLGPGCDEVCMRQVAGEPRFYFRADDAGQLQAVFDRILKMLDELALRSLEITDDLSPTMTYVDGSAQPPSYLAVTGGRVHWRQHFVSAGPNAFRVTVKPNQLGHYPTNVVAMGKLVDLSGRVKTWAFDVPYVLVIDPSVPPTITVTAPPSPTPGTPVVPPTPLPPTAVPGGFNACDALLGRVPASVVSAALANPSAVRGYRELCHPSQPPSPWNIERSQLGLLQPNKPFHPLFNDVEWKCGCP